MTLLMCAIKKKKKDKKETRELKKQNKTKLIDRDNGLVVTRKERGQGEDKADKGSQMDEKE